MEPNQKQQNVTNAYSLKRAHEYLENIKQELTKIQWTEGDEAKQYAKIVVAATFVFGMMLYVADLIIQKCLHSLDLLFRWIFG